MPTIAKAIYGCLRCDHVWQAKKPGKPGKCPTKFLKAFRRISSGDYWTHSRTCEMCEANTPKATTTEKRVCKGCGVEQPITAFRLFMKSGRAAPYRQTTCRSCHNRRERERYAGKAAQPADAPVRCGGPGDAASQPGSDVCGIILRVGGMAGNDLAVAVAHGHPDRCEICARCEPLVDMPFRRGRGE